MATQRKITLTFLDIGTARTTGWPLRYVARQLGLWDNRTDIEIHNLLQNGLDPAKFRLSHIWIDGRRTAHVYQTGYSIREQISTAMEELAGDGDDDIEIRFFDLVKRLKFKLEEQTSRDFWRTITHNLDPKWLDSLQDKSYLTNYVAGRDDHARLPLLPSAPNKLFRSGFDTNMNVPKTLVE